MSWTLSFFVKYLPSTWIWGPHCPSVTLQDISLGRFLAKFSQLNAVPSAGDFSNELFVTQLFTYHLSCTRVLPCEPLQGWLHGSWGSTPSQEHAGLQAALTSSLVPAPVAIPCWPEQLSGQHTSPGHAIPCPLFIHPSARVIFRLGYMRTCV